MSRITSEQLDDAIAYQEEYRVSRGKPKLAATINTGYHIFHFYKVSREGDDLLIEEFKPMPIIGPFDVSSLRSGKPSRILISNEKWNKELYDYEIASVELAEGEDITKVKVRVIK